MSDVRELLIKRIAELLKDSDINEFPMHIHVQEAENILDYVFCDPEVREAMHYVLGEEQPETWQADERVLTDLFGPVKETT